MSRALKILKTVDTFLEKHKLITLLEWNAILLKASEEDANIIEKVKGGETSGTPNKDRRRVIKRD